MWAPTLLEHQASQAVGADKGFFGFQQQSYYIQGCHTWTHPACIDNKTDRVACIDKKSLILVRSQMKQERLSHDAPLPF